MLAEISQFGISCFRIQQFILDYNHVSDVNPIKHLLKSINLAFHAFGYYIKIHTVQRG